MCLPHEGSVLYSCSHVVSFACEETREEKPDGLTARRDATHTHTHKKKEHKESQPRTRQTASNTTRFLMCQDLRMHIHRHTCTYTYIFKQRRRTTRATPHRQGDGDIADVSISMTLSMEIWRLTQAPARCREGEGRETERGVMVVGAAGVRGWKGKDTCRSLL